MGSRSYSILWWKPRFGDPFWRKCWSSERKSPYFVIALKRYKCHRIFRIVLHQFQNFPIVGLFQQAIAQSGSSLNPWATEKSIGFFTNKLAVDLDCPTSNSSELVACLRGKPARDIAIFRKKIEASIDKKNKSLVPLFILLL